MDYQLVLDIVDSIAIVSASIVAIYGISSWRREAVWKRKSEIAMEALEVFYAAREAIRIIRNPLAFEEGSDYEVIIKRFKKEKETLERLLSLKFRFMASFDAKTEELFNEVVRMVNDISYAAWMLDNFYYKKLGTESGNRYVDDIEKFEKIIWPAGKDDEIGKKMDQIIERVEKKCRKYKI